MAYTYYQRPVQLLQAEMGLDGMDRVTAGESLDIGEGTRETSDGTNRETSTGVIRSVSGVAELSDFDVWCRLEAADPNVAVILDAGCEVAYGDAPEKDDKAVGGAPIRVPFTKIITKNTGGDAYAYRLHKRTRS